MCCLRTRAGCVVFLELEKHVADGSRERGGALPTCVRWSAAWGGERACACVGARLRAEGRGDDRPKKNERADPDSHAASVVSPNDPETPITRRHLGMSSSFLKRKRVVVCLSAVTTYVTLSL